MAVTILEGLEVEEVPHIRISTMCRLGPINVPVDLKETLEDMAMNENRSVSNTCILLITRGLKYTAEMDKNP